MTANQFVADSFSGLPAKKAKEAWRALSVISDEGTRKIAAQKIFFSLYEDDSLKATIWLRDIPSSQEKQHAVRFLIDRLKAEGDAESAQAWEMSLPR